MDAPAFRFERPSQLVIEVGNGLNDKSVQGVHLLCALITSPGNTNFVFTFNVWSLLNRWLLCLGLLIYPTKLTKTLTLTRDWKRLVNSWQTSQLVKIRPKTRLDYRRSERGRLLQTTNAADDQIGRRSKKQTSQRRPKQQTTKTADD